MSGLVLALVGTDHHPFDRLVRWVDAAAGRHPEVRFVVQHGTARPPLVAEGHAHLRHDQLEALLAEATAVICHGGPGIVTEAREAGHLPLCVPRDPALGEHVDGHQQRFAAMVGRVGVVREVRTLETFERELADALATEPGAATVRPVHEPRDAARALAAAALEELLATVRPHGLGRRRHAHP